MQNCAPRHHDDDKRLNGSTEPGPFDCPAFSMEMAQTERDDPV